MDDFVAYFIEAAKALGVGGGPVFLILWWLERQERKECQKSSKDTLTLSLTTIGQATAGISAITEAVAELKDGLRDSSNSLARAIQSIKRNA